MNEENKTELLYILDAYHQALNSLDDYDHQRLEPTEEEQQEETHPLNYSIVKEIVASLSDRWGSSWLFGKEKDASIHSCIGQVYQTWQGEELYPSVEHKAAVLLYLLVKNHPFSDGNKRIAAVIFLWYLSQNQLLYDINGERYLDDSSLLALILMIAYSPSKEKDSIIQIIRRCLSLKKEK